MEKQSQQTQNCNIQVNEDNWEEAVSLVRYQSEDNKTQSTIQNISINNNTAYITITPTATDQSFTCTLDATINLDDKSEFEKFIEDHGYDATEENITDRLEGLICTTYITTTNRGISLRLQDSSIEEGSPLEDTHDESLDPTGCSRRFFRGSLIGAVPIYNISVVLLLLTFHFDDTETTDPHFLYGTVTSMTLLYVIPLLLYYFPQSYVII